MKELSSFESHRFFIQNINLQLVWSELQQLVPPLHQHLARILGSRRNHDKNLSSSSCRERCAALPMICRAEGSSACRAEILQRSRPRLFWRLVLPRLRPHVLHQSTESLLQSKTWKDHSYTCRQKWCSYTSAAEDSTTPQGFLHQLPVAFSPHNLSHVFFCLLLIYDNEN